MIDSKNEELIEELTASRRIAIQQCQDLARLISSLKVVNTGDKVVAKRNKTYVIGIVKDISRQGITLVDCEGLYFTSVEKLSKDVVDKLYTDVSKYE